MPGYMIFDIEITDQKAWDNYRLVAGPILAASGGRFLANTRNVLPLERDWRPSTLSIVEFSSIEAAADFYHSEAYQRTIALRQGASRGRGIIVEGMPSAVVQQ